MSRTIYSKPALSYLDQLELLKSNGMLFDNKNQALHLLERIGYYRLSGYWYPFLANKQNHIFKPRVHFETVFNLYEFDRELRKIIVAEIEKIEIAVRAKMAYEFSMTHDPFWIEDASLFSSTVNFRATLDKIVEEYLRSNEEFILDFKAKYTNPLPPADIILEITSFGTLARLYRNLKSCKEKRDIAKSFALPDVVFDSWLYSLASVRNICAHHARLWNSLLKIQPLSPRKPRNTWLSDKTVCTNRIYYVLSIMIYLLNIVNPNHTFKQKLENLFLKYSMIDRAAMGFPANWYTETLWK